MTLSAPASLLGRAGALALLALALTTPSASGATPTAAAADTDYGPLQRVGVTASSATVRGRQLEVRLTLRRTVGIRLAIVPGKKGDAISGYAKRRLAPGRYLLKGRLSGRTPKGTGLRLRVTARALNGKRGRQRIALKILPASVTPPPVTPPGATPTPPVPPPPAPANQAPVVTASSGTTAYTENAAPVVIDGALTITDDGTTLTGARVALTAPRTGDTLGFTDQAGITGSFSTGALTLSGSASVADYQAALRSVTYASGETPGTTATVELSVTDGALGSTVSTKDLAITPVADAPTVTATTATLAYTEQEGPVAIDPALTVSDIDSTQLSGATVAITSGLTASQDELAFTDAGGITGSYDDPTGTLTLSGAATLAAYEAALRTVTYENVSGSPSPNRTITFTATDESAASGDDTRAIAITSVNDAPVAVDDTGGTDEDTPLNVTAPGVLGNDTDADTGDTRTVTELNGSTTLTGTSTDGATVTINADGSYSYDPGAVFNGLATGESDSDTFTYTVEDADGASDTATVTITITGVSDAPTPTADSYDVIGNTGLFVGTTKPATEAGKVVTGSLLSNDTDPDTPTANLVAQPVTDATTTLGGTITVAADGSFTYHPDGGDTGVTDTFTYRVCDASPCTSATDATATATASFVITGQVWYVRNTAALGGDGTSDTPFDTLVEAETASGTGDTTFVHFGIGASTGLDTGYVMNANERLIGQGRPLTIDPDGGGPLGTTTLLGGTTGAEPRLTATDEDVVALASGALVDGVQVDPSGTGGGISAGAGTAGFRVANSFVIDTGTAGTQPGIELDGTSGSNEIDTVNVSTGGSATAIGVRVNSAGTVDFSATSIATSGAKALDVQDTNLSTSAFDAITVTGSGTGAVRLNSTTGSTTFGDGTGTDLSLQTTSGATAAFDLSSAGTVTVQDAGTDTISATGGPAVDIRTTNGAALAFDTVSSTNSAGDGITFDDNLTSSFSATGGTISGAAGIGVDVDGGGSGAAFTYPGAITDGSGPLSVAVTDRTGGTTTLSGSIADGPDAGGGISVAGNTGGSVTFSGTSKVLSTGAAIGVEVSSNSTGTAVLFSGGGLDIDTTTGAGFSASAGTGTLDVTGPGNTIDSAGGRAMRVAAAQLGSTGFEFQRISADGGPNGIVLSNTGTLGSLEVTGTPGGTCTAADQSGCSGGEIQSSTGADDSVPTPGGTGIVLNNTMSPSLTRMWIHDTSNYGIRGTDVSGLTIADTVINGVNGTNAPAEGDASLRFVNLTGAATITDSAISGGAINNLSVNNDSGSLDRLTLDGVTMGATVLASGTDGVTLRSSGSATFNVTIRDSFFTSARSDLLDYLHNGTGTGDLDVSGTAFSNSSAIVQAGAGGVSLGDGSQAGTTTFDVQDNTFRNAIGPAVSVFKSVGSGTQTGTFSNNTIGDAATANSGSASDGLRLHTAGQGTQSWTVTGNTIRQYNGSGIQVLAGVPGDPAQNGTTNATITGNVIAQPGTQNPEVFGIYFNIGANTGSAVTACADIRDNTVSAGGGGTGEDIRLRQRELARILVPGYTGLGIDDDAVESLVGGRNTTGGTPVVRASSTGAPGSGFGNAGTGCA